MERLAALDPTNALWLSGIIEYNYDLAKNGDDSARRFAFIAACLGELNAKRGLTAEQRDWLAEAETQIAKLQLH
jgi:hypothetical protein